jgi:hypothetical protein
MKYYIAGFRQQEESALACLVSVAGMSEEEAQETIIAAAINKSDAIVLPLEPEAAKQVLIVQQVDGKWESWIGKLDQLFGSAEEAEAAIKEITRLTRKQHPKKPPAGFPSRFAVMSWTDNPSMKSRQ